MSAKYALFLGPVTSKRGGDRHHVDAHQLCWLYKVRHSECVVVPSYAPKNRREQIQREALLERIKRQGLIELRPRYDGNYTLPTTCPYCHGTRKDPDNLTSRVDLPCPACEQSQSQSDTP